MRRGREEIPVMKKVFQRIRSSGGGRTLALVLSGALLLSTTGLGVYAADLDGSRNGEGGVVLSYKWPDESGIKWLDEDGSWTMTVPVEEDGAFNWGYVHDQLPQSIIAQVQPPQEDEAAESQESGPVPASRMGDETGLISTYSEGDAAGGDSADDANDTDGADDATGTDSTDDANGTDGTDAAPSTGDADTTPGTGDAGTTPGTGDGDAANGTGGGDTTPSGDSENTTPSGDSENTTPDESNGNSNIVESPEERNVNLTWERTSEDSGTIMAEASLPAGYELSDSVPPLTVAVTAAPVELMDDSELSLSDFADFVVPEPDAPQGTVINLFDYWAAGGRSDTDNGHHLDAGINNGHYLKFGQGMDFKDVTINDYTNTARPYEGIVQNTLGNDGFPVLNADKQWNENANDKTEAESLSYLFKPVSNEENGKAAFSNVEGLLQTDEDGYYYYNSQKNYAYFDEIAEEFILYKTWGVTAEGSSPDGQFFPFASPEKVFTIDETSNELTQKEVPSNDGNLNHFFGLSMSTRFVQEEDGKTPGGKDVTYNFSGDDDVWVFIDDVLVADLGGIHDMLSLEINFSTGEVIVYDDKNINNKYDSDSGEEIFNGNGNGTTLRAMFEAAERAGEVEWSENGNTFADGTYHTLKFFYLERGHTDSNLSLKFNLTPIPESEITKVDQVGNPMEDITFDLYATEANFSTDGKTPIWSGTTDEYGNLKILDEESHSAIAFGEFAQEYHTNYFVLKESEAPKGYRSEGETRLEYDPVTGVILSRDYWTTGSYAAPKVMATAKGQLYYENEGGALDLTDEDIDPSNPSTIPTVFAVVFKRLNMNELINSADNWAPISGSLEDGWTVWDGEGEMTTRILNAARNSSDTSEAFKNTFAFGTGGAFQVTVEDLPGDVTSYYWYQAQKAGSGQLQESQVAYTVNYYYYENGKIHRLSTDDFTRRFSTHIYMSNIKDYLLVEKVDENDNPMNGAEFALYEAGDLTGCLNTNGTVDLDALNEANAPYDRGEVNGDGLLLYPTENKEVLEKGTYYLVETDSGNDNYKINPTAVKVIVDETGVYADAGTEDDGVSTGRLVGSVMKKYAPLRAGRRRGRDPEQHQGADPDCGYGTF